MCLAPLTPMLPDNALGVAWAAGHTMALARTLSLTAGVWWAACRSISLAGLLRQARGVGLIAAAWRGVGLVQPVRAVRRNNTTWNLVQFGLKGLQRKHITQTTWRIWGMAWEARGLG